MGYSYKNGVVSGVRQTGDVFNIYLAVFKIINTWELQDGKVPEAESAVFSIARLGFLKENKCKTIIYNDYPEEFVEEISEGLKELGKMDCKSCIHGFKRNLSKHNCSEEYIKIKNE